MKKLFFLFAFFWIVALSCYCQEGIPHPPSGKNIILAVGFSIKDNDLASASVVKLIYTPGNQNSAATSGSNSGSQSGSNAGMNSSGVNNPPSVNTNNGSGNPSQNGQQQGPQGMIILKSVPFALKVINASLEFLEADIFQQGNVRQKDAIILPIGHISIKIVAADMKNKVAQGKLRIKTELDETSVESNLLLNVLHSPDMGNSESSSTPGSNQQ
ncbi:MAG: hypothetical protein HQM08_12585 [Candidatus Riflebacteria bacterium]|nr:hypothetical protein [Candidatus Riflebacteria bacterium]